MFVEIRGILYNLTAFRAVEVSESDGKFGIKFIWNNGNVLHYPVEYPTHASALQSARELVSWRATPVHVTDND